VRNRIARLSAVPVLALALVTARPAPVPADASPVGGRRYFFCAAFQLLKYGGLVTGRPDAVLVGAIGAGVSCAFGW
jgi:hypothetical protein